MLFWYSFWIHVVFSQSIKMLLSSNFVMILEPISRTARHLQGIFGNSSYISKGTEKHKGGEKFEFLYMSKEG